MTILLLLIHPQNLEKKRRKVTMNKKKVMKRVLIRKIRKSLNNTKSNKKLCKMITNNKSSSNPMGISSHKLWAARKRSLRSTYALGHMLIQWVSDLIRPKIKDTITKLIITQLQSWSDTLWRTMASENAQNVNKSLQFSGPVATSNLQYTSHWQNIKR